MRFLKLFIFLIFICRISYSQVISVARPDHVKPDGIDTQGNINLSVSGSTAPYTFTWSPGNLNTQNLANANAGTYTVNIKSASNQTLNCVYNLGYKVLWTNLYNTTFRNDSLFNTTSSTSALGTASSKNTLSSNTDGWFEYIVNAVNSSQYYIGFTDSLSPIVTNSDIDYGIFASSTTLYSVHTGTSAVVIKTGLAIGNIIKVHRVGDQIKYYHNNVLLKTITVPGIGAKKLKLKVSCLGANKINYLGCSFANLSNTNFINYVAVNPVIKHTSSGTSIGSIKVTPTISYYNTYSWSPVSSATSSITSLTNGQYTVLVKDSANNSSSHKFNVGYKAIWNNLDRAVFSNDSLKANVLTTGIFGCSVSKNVLATNTNGWFEFVVGNIGTNNYYIGFSDSLSPVVGSSSIKDIDYGFHYSASKKYIYYYESGSLAVLYSYIKPDDILRIERIGDNINYKINNVILRTVNSNGLSLKNLKLRSVIGYNETLTNVGCSFDVVNGINFKNYVKINPVIKHNATTEINKGSVNAKSQYSSSVIFVNELISVNTNSIFSLSTKDYSFQVKDELNNTSDFFFNIGNKVNWKNLQTSFFRNDTIKATATSSTYGYACSENILKPGVDGWIEYVQGPLTSNNYYIGLVDETSNNPSVFTDILFGVNYSGAAKYYYSYESGTSTLIYNTPNVGDVVRIERKGNGVKYSINGAVIRSLAISNISTKTLKLKVLLGNQNYLSNVGCSFALDNITLGIAKQHASYDNINSGIIGVIATGGKSPYTFKWNEFPSNTTNVQSDLQTGTYNILVVDSLNDSLQVPISIALQNNWRMRKNINIIGNNYINTTSGGDTSGVLISNNFVRSGKDGWTELTIANDLQNTTFGFIGFDSGELEANYSTPFVSDYTINSHLVYADSIIFNRFPTNAVKQSSNEYKKLHLVTFENGYAKVRFKDYPYASIIDYKAGDVFKLQRSGSIISLYKNDKLLCSEVYASETQHLLSALIVKSGTVSINASGSYASDTISAQSMAEKPAYVCIDNELNWVYTKSFDENGNIKSESKEYMDLLGRTIQSQTKSFSTNNVLVSEPMYDSYGRAIGQTLPAPVFRDFLCYVPNFIETNSTNYNYEYFDNAPGTPAPGMYNGGPDYYNQPGDVNNPLPISNTTYGRLGWYYSDNNTQEPLVAADNYPYTRVDFYNDPLGRTKRSAGVGTNHKMGSGHESKMIYTSTPSLYADPMLNELNFVFPYRTYELENDFSVNTSAQGKINKNLQLFKTIAINADGKDQITYTTSDGQTIATCITGDGTGCVSHSPYVTLYNQFGKTNAKMYVPKLKSNTVKFFETSASGNLYNHIVPVITDEFKGVPLIYGTDYTYNNTNGLVTFIGSYANQSMNLNVTYNVTPSNYIIPTGNTIKASVDIDYSQWTLYFYDRKGRLLANASPNDMLCQTIPFSIQKTTKTATKFNSNYLIEESELSRANPQPIVTFDLNQTAISASNKEAIIDLNITLDTLTSLQVDSSYINMFIKQVDVHSDSLLLAQDPFQLTYADITSPLPVDSNLLFKNVMDTNYVFHNSIDSLSKAYHRKIDLCYRENIALSLLGKKIKYNGYITLQAKLQDNSLVDIATDSIPFNYEVEATNYDTITGSVSCRVTGYTAPGHGGGIKDIPIIDDLPEGTIGLNIKPHFGFPISSDDEPSVGGAIAGGVNVGGSVTINQYVPTPIPLHLANKYYYDEYDRLVTSISDDEGRVDYVYDQLEDKLLFTQNDKQRANGGKFNCIVYDKLGRATKAGEYNPLVSAEPQAYYFIDYKSLKAGTTAPSGRKSIGTPAFTNNTTIYDDGRITDPTNIVYDNADAQMPTNLGNNAYAQKFTAAKVSKTYNTNTTTWYSYDELGRLVKSVQYSAELGYKTMDYSYDFRGKLSYSNYQSNQTDMIVHSFNYDEDERLKYTYCGVKDGASMSWLPIADYSYYLHGPLKRTRLGGTLQGLDYVYTIGGMLKSVNNPMSALTDQDPGQDGYATGPNANISADVFGFTLQYYNDDYTRAGSPIKSYNYTSAFGGNNVSYGGLVKNMIWRTTLPAGATDNYNSALMYEYNYDAKYQLTQAQFGKINATTGNQATFTQLPEYKLDNLSYDKNGNIQTLRRYAAPQSGGSTAHLLDDLTYNYGSTTFKNRLLNVADASTNTGGYSTTYDLPNQTNSNNYVYNEIGELTQNVQDNQGYEYNASGLVTRIYELTNNRNINRNIITIKYNDKGLRHSKITYDNFSLPIAATYYSYDAGGALVATYTQDLELGGPVVLKDLVLYGAGRAGMYDAASKKSLFELTDHLGNTRAVITKNTSTGQAETVSYTDYYPHGSTMPGRTYQNTLGLPYAYQGQEKDPETNLLNFELRQYDARLGRWFNPDPYGQFHSPYLAMGNNPISSVDPDGGWSSDQYWGNTSVDKEFGAFKGYNLSSNPGRDNAIGKDPVTLSTGEGNPMAFMTPTERRQVMNLNGTSYAAQFANKVLELAFIGGYEDSYGNLWYYSPRKNDVGAWIKLDENKNFSQYKTGSANGALFGAYNYFNIVEKWCGLGYNGSELRMNWAQKTYGGTGDGGVLDQLHRSFSTFNTKYNPVAHGVNGITGLMSNSDRFGNEQSGLQTATNLVSAATFIFGTGISNAVTKLFVGEAKLASSTAYVSTMYQVEINAEVAATRAAHRAFGNKSFYNALNNNPSMANSINTQLGYDVRGFMLSGKSGLKNPAGFEWHHQGNMLQLLRRDVHRSPLLQDFLHPGPNGQGGWGMLYGN